MFVCICHSSLVTLERGRGCSGAGTLLPSLVQGVQLQVKDGLDMDVSFLVGGGGMQFDAQTTKKERNGTVVHRVTKLRGIAFSALRAPCKVSGRLATPRVCGLRHLWGNVVMWYATREKEASGFVKILPNDVSCYNMLAS